jgi:hypothetical protein
MRNLLERKMERKRKMEREINSKKKDGKRKIVIFTNQICPI